MKKYKQRILKAVQEHPQYQDVLERVFPEFFEPYQPKKIGQRFKFEEDEYILSLIEDYKVVLINLTSGKGFSIPIYPNNIREINNKEWKLLTKNENFI